MADVGGRLGMMAKGHRVLFGLINVLSLMEVRVAHLCERTKNHGIECFKWVNCISMKLAKKRNVGICADTEKTC